MYLFTADEWAGEMARSCGEGDLEWVPKEKITALPIWEGDRIFLRLLAEERPAFLLTVQYEGDRLVRAVLDGRPLPLPYT